MKVIQRRLTDVIPYGRNPRKNQAAVDAVASSIRQFGWQQPIVVDAQGVIIAGHTRYLAAERLGMAKVPVVVAKDLTADKVQAYRIADNKLGEIAEWDETMLATELRMLSEAGWGDMKGLGFGEDELDRLLSPLAEAVDGEEPAADPGEGEQPADGDEEPEDDQAPAEADPRGELQRRFGAILDSEAFPHLSKSALRVLHRVRQWASFDRCTFHVSLRTLAAATKTAGTTARRGLDELLDMGLIRQREETVSGCRVFEIVVPKSVRPAVRRDDRGEEHPWE
jgi:hypothetical protein